MADMRNKSGKKYQIKYTDRRKARKRMRYVKLAVPAVLAAAAVAAGWWAWRTEQGKARETSSQTVLSEVREEIPEEQAAAAEGNGGEEGGVMAAEAKETEAGQDASSGGKEAEAGQDASSGGKEAEAGQDASSGGKEAEAGRDASSGGKVTEAGQNALSGGKDADIASREDADGKRLGNVKVKGVYVTGPMAGNEAFGDILKLVDETELNAMVIDVKNDEGKISWNMDLESARILGACTPYIGDIGKFMETLEEHKVYTIARISCFKDPCLAGGRPELALKKRDGSAVTDGNGMAWVNPYRKEVWEYLTEIAEAAAEAGFDEVQFDYVRFPIGSDAEEADYGVDMGTYPKQQAICGFLEYAVNRLHEKDIIVTADVFGTIIGSDTDVEQVGQDYAKLGELIDVLSPMVYPSHYGSNVFGLKVPDAHPYETVLAALEGSAQELSGIPEGNRAAVRPWLQAFTATWVKGHISYGGEQIRQQIQAVYDAGYEEWILWNAVNRYSADGLLTTGEAEEGGGAVASLTDDNAADGNSDK